MESRISPPAQDTESEVATARRLRGLCHDYIFEQKRFTAPQRRAQKKNISNMLIHQVTYPNEVLVLFNSYAVAMKDASAVIDFSVTHYYDERDKTGIVKYLRDETFATLNSSGPYYRKPELEFRTIAPIKNGKKKPMIIEGKYCASIHKIDVADALKTNTLEKMITIAAHEDFHGLIREYRRHSIEKPEYRESTGMQWSEYEPKTNDIFYTMCPEEALVRRAASHTITLLATNKQEIAACVCEQLDGYHGMAAAHQFNRFIYNRA